MISKIVVSVILGVVFLPLVSLLFFGIDSILLQENSLRFIDIFLNNKLFNSIHLSLLVSILSTLIALCTSILYYHIKSDKTRSLFLLTLLLLFAIAPVIYTSVFSEIKIFSMLGALSKSVIVLTLWLTPMASGLMIIMMKNIDESSLISFKFFPIPKFTVFKTIILKQIYFALFGTSVLIFMMAFVQEEVPSFFGLRTYAEEFLSRIILMEEFESTLIYASPFAIFAFISALTLYYILKRNSWSLFQDQITPLRELNLLGSEKFSYVYICIFCFIVLFVIYQLIVTVDFGVLGTLLSENTPMMLNSLWLSILASFIATSLSVYIVNYFNHKDSIFKMIFLIACLSLYWFLPSSLTGLALLKFSQLFYIDSEVYEYFMLVYGYVLRVLPIGMIIMLILSQHTPSSHLLKHLHIPKQHIFLSIVLPIQWRGWLMVFVIVFFLLLSEITTTVLLVPAGFETIIVKIYNLMHYGDFETVAFLSLLQILLILLGLSVFKLSRDFYDKT